MNKHPSNRRPRIASALTPTRESGSAVLPEVDALKLLNELQVHQVELAQQNVRCGVGERHGHRRRAGARGRFQRLHRQALRLAPPADPVGSHDGNCSTQESGCQPLPGRCRRMSFSRVRRCHSFLGCRSKPRPNQRSARGTLLVTVSCKRQTQTNGQGFDAGGLPVRFKREVGAGLAESLAVSERARAEPGPDPREVQASLGLRRERVTASN